MKLSGVIRFRRARGAPTAVSDRTDKPYGISAMAAGGMRKWALCVMVRAGSFDRLVHHPRGERRDGGVRHRDRRDVVRLRRVLGGLLCAPLGEGRVTAREQSAFAAGVEAARQMAMVAAVTIEVRDDAGEVRQRAAVAALQGLADGLKATFLVPRAETGGDSNRH